MYDGIFDDVERVKEILTSYGHNFVDGSLIFHLLENYKIQKVVRILSGIRHQPNLNFLHNSLSLNQGHLDIAESSNSSNDLQVSEDNLASRTLSGNLCAESVDLTIDDHHSVSWPSDKLKYAKTDVNIGDLVASTPNHSETIIDLTEEVREVKQAVCCQNDTFKDMMDSRGEDADATNSTTDSEFEMDDYYRIPYMGSEESEGFGESDGKISMPASPNLAMPLNFVNQNNNDEVNLEPGENRMEEMLEENNNDPNNNLEDIEEMEQNNSSSTTTVNLNIVKESSQERICESPKPGCSKDSYYADTNFCMTDGDSGSTDSVDPKFIAGKRPSIVNIFEDKEFLFDNCERLSDIEIGQDVFMIQKIFPHIAESKILSTIMEHQDAVNRVEIALWEFLPDIKPTPILYPKRRQVEDSCPAPIKKYFQDDLAGKKSPEPGCSNELSDVIVAEPILRSSIIKPAILKFSGNRKSIIKPSKFNFTNSETATTTFTVLNNKSSVTLKPSKLEHPNVKITQNAVDGKAEIPNTISNLSTNLIFKTYREGPCKDNGAAAPDMCHTGAIPNQPNQTVTCGPSDMGKKIQDEICKYEPYPAARTILGKNSIRSEIQKLNVILKKPIPIGTTVNPMDRLLDLSKQVIEKTGTVAETVSPILLQKVEKTENHIMNNLGRNHFEKSRLPSDQNNHKWNDTTTSFKTIPLLQHTGKAALLATQLIESSIENEVPGAANINLTEVLGTDLQTPKELPCSVIPKDGIRNEKSIQIAHQVENIQLEYQNSLRDILIKDSEVPKLQSNSQFQPNEMEEQFNIICEAVNDLKAEQSIVLTRIEKPEIAPPKELFNPLINMFPAVDPKYISELCISAKLANRSLESLVEVLLVNGVTHPRIINPEPEPQDLNPDTQYENLQGIFPNAHLQYLRGIAEKYYNDPEAMKSFVQAKLENPDYPTMADHLKKIKITEQIKHYTVEFSAYKFLQIFPDPFTHFENPKRVYRYNVIVFEFLKGHFRMNKVSTIVRAYRCPKHPFHMSLAAKWLESIGADMKTKRPEKPLLTEDIPLLQEFAFIRHKAEIKEYIKVEKLKEKQEFERLKERNELLECQCCYDAECMPSKCLSCNEGHIFCKLCIKAGSATKIGEGQTYLPCFVECKGEFTLPVLQKVLEPTMFSILLRKRQEEEVKAAGLEGLVSCPFCHFASIPPPEDKVFKCLNPECMKETCRFCKELNHVPLHCDEIDKGEEARHYLEEKMTEALVRKCYRCSRPFFKDEGCNKMTCPCGATTCYICGEPVKDYKHFNGQGSDRTDLCPLWSDNKILNARTVRVVAEAAEKEILKRNPRLKIDAKTLMPSLPQASRGPHQDIANAHVLPVQARKT